MSISQIIKIKIFIDFEFFLNEILDYFRILKFIVKYVEQILMMNQLLFFQNEIKNAIMKVYNYVKQNKI